MKKFSYQTSDLATAAFLLCSPGITFSGLIPKNPKSKYFIFGPHKRAADLAAAFVGGKARVIAKNYADAMRTAKDLIFAEERSGNR